MRVGLQQCTFSWPGGPARLGEQLAGIATQAEDAGSASFWLMEAYTAIGFFAARTSRIKLGTLVSGAVYRYPCPSRAPRRRRGRSPRGATLDHDGRGVLERVHLAVARAVEVGEQEHVRITPRVLLRAREVFGTFRIVVGERADHDQLHGRDLRLHDSVRVDDAEREAAAKLHGRSDGR